MTNLFGLTACYVAIILLGQRTQKPGSWTNLYTAIIALLQTAIILLHLFTLEEPLQ